ncbi:MAG TPA: dihydropteroate synthase [Gemmatimonadales bacterium]|nr:dihydropteroate synthase [Gemmatimonadales bacterium]
MNVVPLALHSPRAIRDALTAHGWEPGPADNAAGGLAPLAFHLTELDQGTLEALVRFAGRLGLEVLTGDTWAILSGSRSRLSAFARPWTVPEPLRDAAIQVGLAMPAEAPAVWLTARGPIAVDRPVLMGVLNVTPDSFSDGGQFAARDAALAHADRLLEAGATVIDVGGESTRPGRSEGVSEEEERRRVLPVIEALVRRHPDLCLSIDTVKSAVARAALEAGAAIVNDVTAFRLDPQMADVAAASRAGVVLMHSRGPLLEISSYAHAIYGEGVVGGVLRELGDAMAAAVARGVAPEAICLDPGFGFSKTVEQNLELFDGLAALQALARPLLVGPSRKRFVGVLADRETASDRDRATATLCALAWERGARLFRVHDVAAAREALAVAQLTPPPSPRPPRSSPPG